MNSPVLVLASHNAGKVREIRELLSPLSVSVEIAQELGLAEPEEKGRTFAENAALKSEVAALATGRSTLADDSGLVVRALHGAPGVFSARWAGPERNFGRAMRRVEFELKRSGSNDRSAKFVCALALTVPGRETTVFEGEVCGELVFPPRGTGGFGYDPIFVANGMCETFGEIDEHRKMEISHRARAFAKFLEFVVKKPIPA